MENRFRGREGVAEHGNGRPEFGWSLTGELIKTVTVGPHLRFIHLGAGLADRRFRVVALDCGEYGYEQCAGPTLRQRGGMRCRD